MAEVIYRFRGKNNPLYIAQKNLPSLNGFHPEDRECYTENFIHLMEDILMRKRATPEAIALITSIQPIKTNKDFINTASNIQFTHKEIKAPSSGKKFNLYASATVNAELLEQLQTMSIKPTIAIYCLNPDNKEYIPENVTR